MNKEEAIRILKNFSLCGVYHQLIHMNDTDSEAISMAIKALEQPELCDDAISIDWITEYMNNLIGGSDRWWGVKWILEDWTKWKESKKR